MMRQCGLCARWVGEADGVLLESTNRNSLGKTYFDNFICYVCNEECTSNWFMERQKKGMVSKAVQPASAL
jgi:hypothetical protein